MSVARYWSPKAWRPTTIGFVQPGTSRGTFEITIGSRKIMPPRMLRIVPLGDLYISLEAELLDARLVGRDRRALHADAVLLDRVGRVDGDLVVGLVALLDRRGRSTSARRRGTGRISCSLINSQMIRVISSPSSSTMGFLTLILAMRSCPPCKHGGAGASDVATY